MELDRKRLEMNLLHITNDENQKENRAADQFFQQPARACARGAREIVHFALVRERAEGGDSCTKIL